MLLYVAIVCSIGWVLGANHEGCVTKDEFTRYTLSQDSAMRHVQKQVSILQSERESFLHQQESDRLKIEAYEKDISILRKENVQFTNFLRDFFPEDVELYIKHNNCSGSSLCSTSLIPGDYARKRRSGMHFVYLIQNWTENSILVYNKYLFTVQFIYLLIWFLLLISPRASKPLLTERKLDNFELVF